MRSNWTKQPEDAGEVLTSEAFARGIQQVLRKRHPKWAEDLDFDDLKRWVEQLGPIPPQAVLNISDWASAYYKERGSQAGRGLSPAEK